jgi:squalene-hopene/tetraprenyl-beta-curcumene cyclase
VRRAIVRTRRWLVEQQQAQGHWQGEHETAGLESHYILLLAWLDELDSPHATAAARWLLRKQLPDGGWARYPDGELDLSTSVLAYFALKLTGHEPHQAAMQRAREAILQAGGADQVDATARFFLAILGQIPFDACPSATRSLPASLQVIRGHQPVQTIDARKGIRELFVKHPTQWPQLDDARFMNRLERFSPSWLRRRALAQAERQVSESCEPTASSIIWTTIALKCLGSADDSPQVRACRRRLDELIVEQDELVRVQPWHRPVTDTALALQGVLESGLHPESETVHRAADWLLEQLDTTEVGDRALAALALTRQFQGPVETGDSLPPGLHLVQPDEADDDRRQIDVLDRTTAAMGRIETWLLARQDRDGGWGSPDRTGHVLAVLGTLGRRTGDAAIDRAVNYLARVQAPDGSWVADEGIGRIYGTFQSLTGLVAVGLTADHTAVAAGANWLLAHQQACGGWGESAESCQDPTRRGQGPITASQTAWALLGLIAAGLAHDPATLRGVRFLVSEQADDGTWPEPEFTARWAGVVCRSQYQSICYPLLALSRWALHKQ